jgi:phosphoribosyl-AMP cyclohydrolase / phosphoribosyl-ATP pyrophosphohydrolase
MTAENLDFEKLNGLVPAVVQDARSGKVLMLGFMNPEAYSKTLEEGYVTFYSRTKKRLWKKGEESGNYLKVVSIKPDCDQDSLLILAIPSGPVCHRGTETCFSPGSDPILIFLSDLQRLIENRKNEMPENSYTTSLFKSGRPRIIQKVGEEAVELVIEAMQENDELFLNEAADLMFHLEVLLTEKGFSIEDVVNILRNRHAG